MHLKNALILQVSMVELVDAGMIQNIKFNYKRNKKLVSLMASPKDSSEIYLRKQAEDGIRDQPRSRGLGDVYKRQRIFGELKAKQMHSKNAPILQVSMVELADAGMIQNTKFNCKRNKKLVSLMVSLKDSSEIYLRKQVEETELPVTICSGTLSSALITSCTGLVGHLPRPKHANS